MVYLSHTVAWVPSIEVAHSCTLTAIEVASRPVSTTGQEATTCTTVGRVCGMATPTLGTQATHTATDYTD